MSELLTTLVKDSKAKIIHHLNKTTGESFITYKVRYFLQRNDNPMIQKAITKVEAGKIAKERGIPLSSVPECHQWSSIAESK